MFHSCLSQLNPFGFIDPVLFWLGLAATLSGIAGWYGRRPGPQLETRTDWKVGDSVTVVHAVRKKDIVAFAAVSGDCNPVHLDEAYAKSTRFKGRIAHGMLSAAYISACIGTRIPGPGAIYLSQSLKFRAPVRAGDSVSTTVTIDAYDTATQRMKLSTICINQEGTKVLTGEAEILYEPALVATNETPVAAGTAS